MKLIFGTLLSILLVSSSAIAYFESSADPMLAERGNVVQANSTRFSDDTPLGRICDDCETDPMKGGMLKKGNPALGNSTAPVKGSGGADSAPGE